MRLILLFFTLFFVQVSAADVSVASFNIKHYGWNNGKDVNAVASIISEFDLVAIQELMDENELTQLERLLEKKTNIEWHSMASHPIGRSRYKEQYGFIWNDNIEYETGAVVYIDDRDIFEREPMSLQFKSKITNTSFVLASVHIVFGDSVSDREHEIKALSSYWDWLGVVYSNVPRIMAGDFNLPPDHEYFYSLKKKANPIIISGKTTLSSTDNRYASLYDNLFVEKNGLKINEFGIYKFPEYLDMTHKEAKDKVSDHVPVYLTLGDKTMRFSNKKVAENNVVIKNHCVNINTSSAEDLTKLSGVGEARAQDIINGRPWKNIESLSNINGIGPATVKKIKNDEDLCR